MRRIFIFFCLFPLLAPAQRITDDLSESEQIRLRIKAVERGTIHSSTFLYPRVEKRSVTPYKNLLPGVKKLRIEPVLGIRWSTAGFEMDPQNSPGPVMWVSPGVKMSYSTYVVDPLLNIWLYAWGRFHKHSAYGFNGNKVTAGQKLFPYTPRYSMEYYNQSVKPENGIDFDETLGGVALITPAFDVIWGKFRNDLGPGYRGNLQLSGATPGYSQIRLHAELTEKIHFTWLLGQLSSGIRDSLYYAHLYPESEGLVTKIPQVARYIASHRMDFILTKRFRIGLWEQVIFAARNIPFEYANPFVLYWSAQHEQGDVDNVQMGMDWEWMTEGFRIFGSFFMDEWALYDTFDAENEHNWFGWQGGASAVRSSPWGKFFFLVEYSWMDPRTYIHRFEVNDPAHHGYNLGYWSGGNSGDLYAGIYFLPDEKNTFGLYFSVMQQGDQDRMGIYRDEFRNWTAQDGRYRQETGFRWNRLTDKKWQFEVEARYLDTRHIYQEDRFWDLTVKMLYNISR